VCSRKEKKEKPSGHSRNMDKMMEPQGIWEKALSRNVESEVKMDMKKGHNRNDG